MNIDVNAVVTFWFYGYMLGIAISVIIGIVAFIVHCSNDIDWSEDEN